MTFFKIGDVVEAEKFGQLEHNFSGVVEKVYDNSIMVSIDDYDPSDKSSVNELNKRAVVRKTKAKILKAVPRTDEDRELAAQEEKEAAEKAAKNNKGSRKRKKAKPAETKKSAKSNDK